MNEFMNRTSGLLYGVLAGATMVIVCLAEDAKPQQVGWDDLKEEFEFEDPFAELSEEQLMDLGIIARVQSLEKRDGGSRVTDGMRKEAGDADAKLRKQGVDVDGLFAKRHEITELRKKKANATVKELDNQLISIPGFVLPLEYEGKKVTEFLLVPWVGACIHTPPPPPNQIVHITAKSPFSTKGMFEAVTVTGIIKLKEVTKSLYLVDGTSNINTSYTISGAEVRKYEKNP